MILKVLYLAAFSLQRRLLKTGAFSARPRPTSFQNAYEIMDKATIGLPLAAASGLLLGSGYEDSQLMIIQPVRGCDWSVEQSSTF